MAIETIFLTIIIMLLIIVLSSLPLYFSVKLLGGRTSILKTFFVMLIVGVLTIFIQATFSYYGTIIAWFLLIWIFREMFRLKWIKAIIAWVLWVIFTMFFIFIFGVLGFSFLALSLF